MMKIVVLILIMLISISFIASASPVAVGGDFGQTWISSHIVKNPSPVTQGGSSSSPANWGSAPKVQGTIGSNMVSQQNVASPISPGFNWLGDTTILGKPLTPQNFTPVPFFVNGGLNPVHAIDASWNHTALMPPKPDAYGLIHGWDADAYYAIGPALDYF